MEAVDSFLAILLTVVLLIFHNRTASETPLQYKVILVSMDGFKSDYLTMANTTNFKKMLSLGVSMPYINNTFVTQSIPCHYSIATGRYEESHGIVGNHMYDPVFNSYFTKETVESRWWDEAEPVWVTARKAGLKTGVYFWPGSEVEIQGIRPNAWSSYNRSVPGEERVEVLLQWITKDNFDLGLLYFDEPDHTGHVYGPDAPETIAMVERMDGILGLLLQGIENSGLKDRVDLIVMSDHGLINTDTFERLIDLRDYANSTLLLEVVEEGPVAHLRPQPGKELELIAALSQAPHMTVLLKEDIPEHYYFKNHRRVLPVFAIAEDGWRITKNATMRRLSPHLKGGHSSDIDKISVKPIFVAMGPDFKSGETVEPIIIVDVYLLICQLLHIQPSPNNGSLERVLSLLKPDLFELKNESFSSNIVNN